MSNLKKLVRARMAKTGESYQSALFAVRNQESITIPELPNSFCRVCDAPMDPEDVACHHCGAEVEE